MKVTSVRVFPTPAVEAALREALAHVETIQPPEHLEEAVFTAAVTLISQAATVVEQPTAIPLPPDLLNHKGR